MNDDLVVNEAKSSTFGVPGRCINEVRNHHFVMDEPAYLGGPGEEIGPADSFLAGISGCGALLVQSTARKWGVPLEKVEVVIRGVRNRAEPSRFQRVNMRFELSGPTEEQARKLVEAYQER